MDNCPKCGGRLFVKEGAYTSEVGSTDVYLTQELSCCNKDCDNYDKVIDTIKHKLN